MGWWPKKQENRTNDQNNATIFLNNKTNKNYSMQEFFPKNYQEIEPIAKAMILQKPIRVILNQTVAPDRRRIIDFLCGIAFVIGFIVDKTNNDTYEFKFEN